jgi:hypothetical protein
MTIFNGTVYLAGQVAADATQDIRGQTRQVLAAIDKLLAEAGTDNAAHPDGADLPARPGRLRGDERDLEDWVAPGDAPPRATVSARLAKAEWKIEIVVTSGDLNDGSSSRPTQGNSRGKVRRHRRRDRFASMPRKCSRGANRSRWSVNRRWGTCFPRRGRCA